MRKRAMRALLLPAAMLYRAATVVDRRRKLRRRFVSRLPVVSIGNLTTGGSGKTQIILALLRRLQRERPVIVLSRGYGRADRTPRIWRAGDPAPDPSLFGDEPALLAGELSNGAIGVASDRAMLLRTLEAEFPSGIVLLDDGFQHHRLDRDLDIVIVDSRTARNWWMLPAGPLREHPSALRRADIVLCDSEAAVAFAHRWAPRVPVTMIRQKTLGICSAANSSVGHPSGAPLLVTGIANPRRVLDSLESVGIVPSAQQRFADHHRYSGSDIRSILASLRESGADWIVTTSKDAIKLVRFPEVRDLLYVLDVEMIVEDIDRIVETILAVRK